mmetsp:Transcript_1501/g.2400  ORF Transcript_1501/g.2400 Transcript_1501/m.2400 type:complete len:304 (+) Transcript_1501:794-1705(+)
MDSSDCKTVFTFKPAYPLRLRWFNLEYPGSQEVSDLVELEKQLKAVLPVTMVLWDLKPHGTLRYEVVPGMRTVYYQIWIIRNREVRINSALSSTLYIGVFKGYLCSERNDGCEFPRERGAAIDMAAVFKLTDRTKYNVGYFGNRHVGAHELSHGVGIHHTVQNKTIVTRNGDKKLIGSCMELAPLGAKIYKYFEVVNGVQTVATIGPITGDQYEFVYGWDTYSLSSSNIITDDIVDPTVHFALMSYYAKGLAYSWISGANYIEFYTALQSLHLKTNRRLTTSISPEVKYIVFLITKEGDEILF